MERRTKKRKEEGSFLKAVAENKVQQKLPTGQSISYNMNIIVDINE